MKVATSLCRKRAVEKLMTQCHDLLDAASHTETKFTVLLKSCSHTQFLDQNVVNKVREGVAALNQVKTQLSKEMKSGHPDQKKVRFTLYLLGKRIYSKPLVHVYIELQL